MARRRNSAKPVIKETFTLYTPESVEAGDAADRGWIDEEGVDMTPDEYDREEGLTAVDKAVKHLRNAGGLSDVGIVVPSSSSFRKGIWYTAMYEEDGRTGEQEERGFHLDGFSPEEERAIFEQMTARRRFNPRALRRNPPLPEHMADDDLNEIARLLAARFAGDIADGRASTYSMPVPAAYDFQMFVRTLSEQVFSKVESLADDSRIPDSRQAHLSDLGEAAMQVVRHTPVMLSARTRR